MMYRGLTESVRQVLLATALIVAVPAVTASVGLAADPPPVPTADEAKTQAEEDKRVADLIASMQFNDGEFDIGGNLAHIKTGKEFRYLNAADARKYLVDLWGNPPSAADGVLGMLVPATTDGKVDPSSYAIIIEYDDSGYVKDEDADKINYDELMNDMQAASREASAERKSQGYGGFQLIGWAQKPVYDKAAKKMYWAKRLHFDGQNHDTLNYNIRVLGRGGVLVLNAVAGIDELDAINQQAPVILEHVEFKEGQTYAEFNPSVDKVAAYGLAGLVAGGVLTKTGFFKAALAAILAFKKVIGVGLAAGAAAIWRFITGRKKPDAPDGRGTG
jgi:uncharacterized membrane-anchored protein